MIFAVRRNIFAEAHELVFYTYSYDMGAGSSSFVAYLAITPGAHIDLKYVVRMLPGYNQEFCFTHEKGNKFPDLLDKLESMSDYLIQLYAERYG